MEHRALCGWLMKQDAQRLWKGWKKRWFQQLNDYQLYYFASCTTDVAQSKGSIDLKAVVNVQLESKSESKYVFSVSTRDRKFVLQANSEDEASYWISGLNSILASLSQPLTSIISKSELYMLETTKQNVRAQLEAQATVHDELQRKLADAERTCARQTEELRARDAELREKDAELSQLRAQCEEVRAQGAYAQEELARARGDLAEKMSVLENEIQEKENIILQLNSQITSLNGELSSKDILLENARKEISYPDTPFDNAYAVAMLEKERQTRQALQEQCAFLGQEVYKLETECKHLRALSVSQKSKILERKENGGGGGGSTSSSDGGGWMVSMDDEDKEKIKFLTLENEELRQKYFLSVGRSLKLQTSMTGRFSNQSITELYDQAVRHSIKLEDWPNWISKQLQHSLITPSQ